MIFCKRTQNKIMKEGFTLLELLIAIAIISILASIVFVSVNSARSKARDAERVVVLGEFKKALEFYFDDFGYYPPKGNAPWADFDYEERIGGVCQGSGSLSANELGIDNAASTEDGFLQALADGGYINSGEWNDPFGLNYEDDGMAAINSVYNCRYLVHCVPAGNCSKPLQYFIHCGTEDPKLAKNDDGVNDLLFEVGSDPWLCVTGTP
jgi:prepilin-type N-terminal cleavage/methylation domain-containing protein